MRNSQPEGSGFVNGLIASGAISVLSISLAAIGVGIILVGCWHQVDSSWRLTD